MCGVKEIEMDILYRLNELKNFLKVFFLNLYHQEAVAMKIFSNIWCSNMALRRLK